MTMQFKSAVLSLFMLMGVSFAFAQADDDFQLKKKETKIVEVVATDSIPLGEMMKRVQNWIKAEHLNYKTSGGSTEGSKVECEAAFPVKPKELNPKVDWTGKISMKVVVELKDTRYRYTISDIKHTSKSGQANGGSIDNIVPECGSMVLTDYTWKHIQADALKYTKVVVADLKTALNSSEEEKKDDEW